MLVNSSILMTLHTKADVTRTKDNLIVVQNQRVANPDGTEMMFGISAFAGLPDVVKAEAHAQMIRQAAADFDSLDRVDTFRVVTGGKDVA